jgi:TolB protein
VAAGESRTYEGEVDLPEGGWIAARAYASQRQDDAWPTMHARPFAHTSPIWIGAGGSTEPQARRAAAGDLLRAVENARTRAQIAYGERDMTRMYARFDAAREALTAMGAAAPD